MKTVAAVCEECGAHFQVEFSGYSNKALSENLTCDSGHSTDLYFAVESESLPERIHSALEKLGGARRSPVRLHRLITHIAFRGYLDEYLEGHPFRNTDSFLQHLRQVNDQVRDAFTHPPLSGSVIVTSGFGSILDPDSAWIDDDPDWLDPKSKWVATRNRWCSFIEDELGRSTQWSGLTEDGESTWLENVRQIEVLSDRYGITELSGKTVRNVIEDARQARKFVWEDKLSGDYSEAFFKYEREEINILDLQDSMSEIVQTASTYASGISQYRDADALVSLIFQVVEDRKPASWGDHRTLLKRFQRLQWLVYALTIALVVVAYFVPAINTLVSDLVKNL